MDVEGVNVRETELDDGYMWEWEWPNVHIVERELRWSTQAHRWAVGMRVDNAGWNFQDLIGEPWKSLRDIEKARPIVERYIARDCGREVEGTG